MATQAAPFSLFNFGKKTDGMVNGLSFRGAVVLTNIDSARFIGVDNIRFSTSAVPEPGAFGVLAVMFLVFSPLRFRK